MHWTLAMIACFVAWAFVAAPWRKGSLVLAVSWMAGQAVYIATGEAVPIWLYAPLDVVVLASVLYWRTTWLDWIIAAIFPLQWWAYFNLEGAGQWWVLWALAAVQMLAAGPWPNIYRALYSFTHGPLRAKSKAA